MSSITSLRSSASQSVLGNAFDTNYNSSLKYLNQIYEEDVEIEARLTEYSDHCPLEKWHIFDNRLRILTDVFDDYVQSIENPNLVIPFTRFRRYVYGGSIQSKYSICKFGTSSHSSAVPILFRISKENELSDLGEIGNYVQSTQRLFRQSFLIKPIESLPLLANWRVDKSVRYIMEGEAKYIPVPKDSTIDKPVGYSLLDIEFEYLPMAPREKLVESVVQLIEFINDAVQPKLYSLFSTGYILFEKLISINFNEKFFSRNKLFGEMAILNRNTIDRSPVAISIISRRCVVIILGREETEIRKIVLYEDEIDLSRYRGYGGELFHIIYCFTYDGKFIPIDISVYGSRVIARNNLEERMAKLEEVKIEFSELFTECEKGETIIHRTEDCNNIRYMPSEFIISFKLSMKKDECEFHLLDSNDIPFRSPFIFSKSFSPLIGRSEFEDAMSKCLSIFDGKVVDFKIRMNGSKMEILPFQFGTEAVNSIEAIHVMFRAYYSWAIREGKIIEEFEQKDINILDIVLQAAIEKLLVKDLKTTISHRSNSAVDFFSNLCIYSPDYALESSHLLYISSLTANSENLIIHGSPSAVITNLDEYYSTSHKSRPIFNSLNITNVPNVIAIDENLSISSVGEFFDNSINGLATPFLKLNVKRLVDLYKYILRNKTVRTIVLLNILDGPVLTHYGEGGENYNENFELPFECRLNSDNFISEYEAKPKTRFSRELMQKVATIFNLSIHVNANPYETVCETYYSNKAIDREFGAIVDSYDVFENNGVLFTKDEITREDMMFIIKQAKLGWISIISRTRIRLTSVRKIDELSTSDVYVYSSIALKKPQDTISRYIYSWFMQKNNYLISKLIEDIGSIIHYKIEKKVMVEDQEFRSILERDLLIRKKYLDKSKEMDLSKLISIKIIF